MRHRSLLLTLLAVGLYAGSSAQIPTFQWARQQSVYATNPLWGQGEIAIAPDGADGLYAMGLDTVKSLVSGANGPLRMVRYSATGTVLMTKTYRGRGRVNRLRPASGKRLLLTGNFFDSLRLGPAHLLTGPTNNAVGFVTMLDSTGNAMWTHTYNTISQTSGANGPVGSGFDAAGNVYVGVNFGGLGSPTSIFKYTGSGVPVSTITQNTGISGMAVDGAGNVYVSGGCVNTSGRNFNGTVFAPVGISGNGYNQFLARYSPTGVARWVKFVGDVTCGETHVACAGANTIYWAGTVIDSMRFDNIVLAQTNSSNAGFHLARLDTTGAYQWVAQKPVGTSTATPGYGDALAVDSAGNAYLAGHTRDTIQWMPGLTTTTGIYSYADPMLLKFNPSGSVAWVKTASSPDMDMAEGLTTAGSSVFMHGSSRATLRFDADSLVPPSTAPYLFFAKIGSTPTSSSEEKYITESLRIFPNPATASLAVEASSPVSAYRIIDFRGRVILQASGMDEKRFTIALRSLPAGMYVLRVRDAAGWQAARFVKRD